LPTIDPRIVADLKRERLLKEGHWAFEHGAHSSGLIDRDHLLSDPTTAAHMAYAIAKAFFTEHIETVAAPSIWGAGLAQLTAGFLDPRAKVAFATPDDDGMTIAPRIDDLVRGKRLLLVDNIIRTGETMAHLVSLVADRDGEVVGIATLWNLGEAEIDGHPVFALLNAQYAVYRAATCPLCASGSTAEAAPY
jgi:orotate phosphoribosyltransferase